MSYFSADDNLQNISETNIGFQRDRRRDFLRRQQRITAQRMFVFQSNNNALPVTQLYEKPSGKLINAPVLHDLFFFARIRPGWTPNRDLDNSKRPSSWYLRQRDRSTFSGYFKYDRNMRTMGFLDLSMPLRLAETYTNSTGEDSSTVEWRCYPSWVFSMFAEHWGYLFPQ